MNYVTYDNEGRLTGAYQQDLHPTHTTNHFPITNEQAANWPAYRMNAARNGLEPAGSTAPVGPALATAIPMLNLHLVLIEDGHLDDVEATINAMPGDEGKRARAYWNKALTARRDNELVNTLWPMLYPDETAFNEAWARAAALNP